MVELRCPNKKHGTLITPGSGIVEIKCVSRYCGAAPGQLVLHQFDVSDGKLINTARYRNPERKPNATHRTRNSVRAS